LARRQPYTLGLHRNDNVQHLLPIIIFDCDPNIPDIVIQHVTEPKIKSGACSFHFGYI